jgi:mRNA-degrading endonuclease toxin of MazEF toxin-antitoxin module
VRQIATIVQTIAKSKLGSYMTHLAPEKLRELRAAIGFALGLMSLSEGWRER